jgi:hypothetical protein
MLRPNPLDGIATKSTLTIFDLLRRDQKMGSINNPLFTTRAESRVHLMSWDISDIHVFQPLFFGNPISPLQCPDRCGWKIEQFILWEKSIEVNGDILSQVDSNPQAHLPDIFGVVIQCRNHQVDDFEMPPIRFDRPESMEDGLQFRGGDLTIKFFCEGFEVYCHSIHIF